MMAQRNGPRPVTGRNRDRAASVHNVASATVAESGCGHANVEKRSAAATSGRIETQRLAEPIRTRANRSESNGNDRGYLRLHVLFAEPVSTSPQHALGCANPGR